MEKQIIFMVPFTGLGLHDGYRGDKWLERRIKIFKEYTLQALLNQKSLNYVLWMCFRPQEKANPQVKELEKHLNKLRGLTPVFTYYGIPFWDDKLSDNEAERKLKFCLRNSLPELKSHVQDFEWIYLMIQPSDDMYLSHVVGDLRNEEPQVGTYGYKQGYIMNYHTKEIAEYNPDTNPPFYAICFDKETFLDPDKHFDYVGRCKSHEFIGDFIPIKYFGSRGFVVGTHGENISTTWDTFRGRTLQDWEKNSIMIRTNTLFSDPIPIYRKWKRFIKYLPFNNFLRKIYYVIRKI